MDNQTTDPVVALTGYYDGQVLPTNEIMVADYQLVAQLDANGSPVLNQDGSPNMVKAVDSSNNPIIIGWHKVAING